ncbi:hypothetical protein RB593_006627 [Gaeumannomyces tritici]
MVFFSIMSAFAAFPRPWNTLERGNTRAAASAERVGQRSSRYAVLNRPAAARAEVQSRDTAGDDAVYKMCSAVLTRLDELIGGSQSEKHTAQGTRQVRSNKWDRTGKSHNFMLSSPPPTAASHHGPLPVIAVLSTPARHPLTFHPICQPSCQSEAMSATSDAVEFPANAGTLEYARSQDAQDPLRHLREHFIFPTVASLKKKALDGKIPAYPPNHKSPSPQPSAQENGTGSAEAEAGSGSDETTPAVYFCGNSLGLQPKAVREHLNAQLETWASVGVHGHFTAMEESPLGGSWQDMAADLATKSVPIVGAAGADEIAIMNTLTANLHFMMASFYRPTATRHKIIAEWKPFPSDTYAIASQIEWHGLDPAKSLVELHPNENFYISTEQILRTIDEHADSTALLLLPGIQYWSGQLFDMERITAHARAKGITVGWDLAHAAGNVPLRLHDWGVDFAVWCTYKYLNAGPGAIAGAFVHRRHGEVTRAQGQGAQYHPRLAGWYGGDKSVRFDMAKEFVPTPGAQGWIVSNPSAIDLAALGGALSVFSRTTMAELRAKSLRLTAYAEHLLGRVVADEALARGDGREPAFRIITPANREERGAQLSVLLREGLLDTVIEKLGEAGVVLDKRKPNVIRVAPVPMYNTFEDVWRCVNAIRSAVMA